MRPANAPRFRRGTDHVESWFVRANDPQRARALWLRSTVLTRRDGDAVAEAWCSVFDDTRTLAFRQQVPLADASYGADGSSRVGPLRLGLAGDGGSSSGELTSVSGPVRWDLAFRRVPAPLGAPMCLLPHERLVDAPFPRNTLLTPFPVATFSGRLAWGEDEWDLTGWTGMQGHNWGAAHSPEYAWAQCVFPDDDAVVEAVSGRIELGRRASPLVSMLVLRRDGEELRFDRLLDLWRQRTRIDFPRWSLTMRGRAGEARLEVRADPAATVCLGYDNPARARSYCLNSKTARVRLEVRPRRGPAYTLESEHGGALEFLRAEPLPEVQPVV
ncbi:hypothetical protein [Nocardioides panaciterrulae]|uniref:Tocopherol cyclase-like protein n=1 Tax=Nocardioides panaciterrulae TaxID=661492 RepID=A0A7Y9E5X5_9ACTN|nr:hypothetical protein [Nocardioides panaciterrulae]NYD41699.1 hypothetical protein [Nocardioides panaciterrulae]